MLNYFVQRIAACLDARKFPAQALYQLPVLAQLATLLVEFGFHFLTPVRHRNQFRLSRGKPSAQLRFDALNPLQVTH